jgi:hypothetical protein
MSGKTRVPFLPLARSGMELGETISEELSNWGFAGSSRHCFFAQSSNPLCLRHSCLLCLRSISEFLPRKLPVGFRHDPDEFFKGDPRLPTKEALRLGGITEKLLDLGGTEIVW